MRLCYTVIPVFPESVIPPWKTMDPDWQILAFLGRTPVNDMFKVLKSRRGGMCTGMFVSEQPFCLRENLMCHLLAGSLSYLRRPRDKKNMGKKKLGFSGFWAIHIKTHTHLYIAYFSAWMYPQNLDWEEKQPIGCVCKERRVTHSLVLL